MRPFSYQRAGSIKEAAQLLGEPGSLALGGGTDLLVSIQEAISAPERLVDVRFVERADEIASLPDGGLRIGAAARLADIARNDDVRSRFGALAMACDAVGSPALRNMGTIGGNLCQRPRCWYFRRGIDCLKNGGQDCPARDGENQYHAILEGGPCYVVHPSDPAVALVALDAEIVLLSSSGTRTVAASSFFLLPRDRIELETVLQPGELVAAVSIGGSAAGGRQLYRKLMQRGSWDFALASIAAHRRQDGDVRMVLGGVAPRPWRVPHSVEQDVASAGLDEDSIAALAERALYDAEPLSRNGYKVALATTLLRDAMRELTAPDKTD